MANQIGLGKSGLLGLGAALFLLILLSLKVTAGGKPQETVAEMVAEATALMAQGRDAPDAFANFHQLIEKIASVYRTDPASDEGYEALKFIINAPWLSDEIYPLLVEHHMDKSDIHQFMAEAGVWQGVSDDKVVFLQEAIKRNGVNPLVRTKARLVLAQDYLAISSFLSSLDEFGTTLQEVIDREVQQVKATQGAESAQFQVMELMQKRYLHARVERGETPNWRELQQQAKGLLVKASEEATANEWLSTQQTPEGEVAVSESKRILKEIAEINRLLERNAPGAVVADVENLINYNGEAVQFSNHRGKVMLLDFWATWCAPCVAAMPGNSTLSEHMKGRPFELITLSVDGDMEDAAEFMEENGYPFTNWYIGPEHAILSDWGIDSYPTVIVVDHKGVIRTRQGVGHEMLEQYIEKLVKEAE